MLGVLGLRWFSIFSFFLSFFIFEEWGSAGCDDGLGLGVWIWFSLFSFCFFFLFLRNRIRPSVMMGWVREYGCGWMVGGRMNKDGVW